MLEKSVLNKLSDDWNGIEDIVIYGFGRVARRNIKKLEQDFKIQYIIDNDPEVQLNNGNKKWDIRRFSDVKDDIGKYKIIVATAASAYESIKKDLEGIDLKEYQNFCPIEEFFVEWYWKNKKMVCLSQVNSSVTSRCTFNCKYCATLMPYFTEQFDYSVDDIIEDLTLLFERVDYLASYYLVGGEPFLNHNLGDIIKTVYEKFGEKIGCIQVISNGSIVPERQTLQVLRECNVEVRLSNYTDEIKYSEKFEEVIRAYQDEKVNYYINKFDWLDLGFPRKIECEWNNEQELKKHMQMCSTGCHALNDKKFYYCGTLFYAEKSGLYQLNENDYVDLGEKEKQKDKEYIMKYCLGEMEKAISLCQYCRGFGADNTCAVKAAEQAGRG